MTNAEKKPVRMGQLPESTIATVFRTIVKLIEDTPLGIDGGSVTLEDLQYTIVTNELLDLDAAAIREAMSVLMAYDLVFPNFQREVQLRAEGRKLAKNPAQVSALTLR